MTRTATRIRPADEDDAHGIAKVHVETWQDVYAGIIPDTYILALDVVNRSRYWSKAIKGEGSELAILVAETEAGRIAGFCSAGPSRRNNQPRGQNFDAEIFTLYVDPNYQNQGYGRALLDGMFETVVENQCDTAFLWVVAANPARFFYEAMGGLRVGERVEKFAGAKLDEIAYAWQDLRVTGPGR